MASPTACLWHGYSSEHHLQVPPGVVLLLQRCLLPPRATCCSTVPTPTVCMCEHGWGEGDHIMLIRRI